MTTTTQYKSLENKVVFITGGASGIGAAMVIAFLKQGARVCSVDIDEDAIAQTTAELDDRERARLHFDCIDVTDKTALNGVIAATLKAHQKIDVLVNNVANDNRRKFLDFTEQDWQKCMQINLDTSFFASQAVAESMQQNGGGNIINFSSVAALLGQKEMTGYITAKAGIMGMTKALAAELGEHKIRVNAIMPGWVATEKQLSRYLNEEKEAQWMQSMALKARILPVDVANLALFLASDDSALITGQGITIDGGKT